MELTGSAHAWSSRLPRLAAFLSSIALLPVLAAGSPIGMVRHVDVLVSALPGAQQHVAAEIRAAGGTVSRRLSVIDGFAARMPSTAVAELGRSTGVRWVSPDRRVHLLGQYGENSGVASAVYTDVVRAAKDWSAGVTGSGVTVAMVDTGVDQTGDLAGQVVHQEDFTAEQSGADSFGHGTFVAGLIAGTGAASGGAVSGVAPGARLVSLKIAGRDGSTDVTRVLEALEWIVDYRDVYNIRIVNLSIGFQSTQSYRVDPLDFAVERVWNDGIVVVTAAGNGGSQSGSITAPGNDPYVITVGASDDKTTTTLADDTVATFSGRGPTADGVAKPDLLAPGKSVVSSRSPGSYVDTTYPTSEVGSSYTRGSGTSFATAIVSGVAALVLQHSPALTPDQVKQRLTTSTRAMGSLLTVLLHPNALGEVDAYAATFSTDNSAANSRLTPSSGGGSLQATRGPACLTDASGACMSDQDANTVLGFDPTRYFGNTWAGNTWSGTSWLTCLCDGNPDMSQWAGSQWVGSQWVGSQWVGSQWVGSQWVGSQWVGNADTSSSSGGLLTALLSPVLVLTPTPADVWGWLP